MRGSSDATTATPQQTTQCRVQGAGPHNKPERVKEATPGAGITRHHTQRERELQRILVWKLQLKRSSVPKLASKWLLRC
ncbi:Hypothetical predicted protein [Podarcis lilfordi]|uniref:Uncharacterized protein n=1 Tax=Podarcis lilfordi TaxID=74358 RepID=A0AA35PUH6_9SAUR|nr:Hypothetical predicted protein [Podarcis lilfordi]